MYIWLGNQVDPMFVQNLFGQHQGVQTHSDKVKENISYRSISCQ